MHDTEHERDDEHANENELNRGGPALVAYRDTSHELELNDATDGLIKNAAQSWTCDGPDRNDQSRGHERDENPPGNVAAVSDKRGGAVSNENAETKKTVVHDDSLD